MKEYLEQTAKTGKSKKTEIFVFIIFILIGYATSIRLGYIAGQKTATKKVNKIWVEEAVKRNFATVNKYGGFKWKKD